MFCYCLRPFGRNFGIFILVTMDNGNNSYYNNKTFYTQNIVMEIPICSME